MDTSTASARTLFLDTQDVARLIQSACIGAYTDDGVIELMPISDGKQDSFKCVNGHPGNARYGLPTVMALLGIRDLRLYDADRSASERLRRNLLASGHGGSGVRADAAAATAAGPRA